MLKVYFDNESINDQFNITLAERPVIPVAEQEYETIQVPGRVEGSLTRKLGYYSKPFYLRFNYIDSDGAKPKYRDIVDWLTGRRLLHFSDEPDFYRVIQKVNPQDAENDLAEYADFLIEMETEPFWYKDFGKQTITERTIITNPTKIETKARLTVFGNGVCRVRINGNQMVFTDVRGHVTVERGIAHRNGNPQNNNMSGQYPIFLPGNNEIEIDGATERVEVDVRWCWR